MKFTHSSCNIPWRFPFAKHISANLHGGISGALSIGKYSIGAAAIATDVAIGDYAKGTVAIGNTTEGLTKIPLDTSIEDIKKVIKEQYPSLSNWIIKYIEFFVKYTKFGVK